MASIDKVIQMLRRQPSDPADFRARLFWLVDVVYACRASEDPFLQEHAELVEEALGALGGYLESGDETQLGLATRRVATFSQQMADALLAQA